MRQRAAFTLIELIFSMVIIAIAFMVLPKILQLATKTNLQNLREEAMFNALSYMGEIKSTAWDENNTEYDDILEVQIGNDCDASTNYIRVGGFIGSRNCQHLVDASPLGSESDDTANDDMDDFISLTAKNAPDTREYNLTVNAAYINDDFSNSTQTTNTKYITVVVQTNKKAAAIGSNMTKFHYITKNIGQIQINKRPW